MTIKRKISKAEQGNRQGLAHPRICGRDAGTVARAVSVLRAFADAEEPLTVTELAEKLDLPPSTIHRQLVLLAAEGMVERDEKQHVYRSGLEFFRMAALIYHRMPLRTLAMPILRNAVDENDESAYVGAFDRAAGKLVWTAHVDSSNLLGYRIPMNVHQSLVTGASGLSILAWLSEEQVDRILKIEASGINGSNHAKRILERSSLLKKLDQIRRRKYAQSFGQRIKGAVGIFAPVFDASSHVVACLGYTIPQLRYETRMLPTLSRAAIKYANELSKALGYSTIHQQHGTIADERNTRVSASNA